MLKTTIAILLCMSAALLGDARAGERINQEGRILGPAPTVSAPILFDTAESDQIVSAMQILPLNNPWNEDISKRPLLSNSQAMISQIITDLGGNTTLRLFYEMNFVLIPDNQPKVDIRLFNYPAESDDLKVGDPNKGSYPIAANMPVELWPLNTGVLTNIQWQQDINGDGGDRHSIMVMPGSGFIWETWLTKHDPLNATPWEASNGAKFDLKSNTLRPDKWTSGDAAGFPMFPALVRYDECERGMVEHAMRIVVKRSRTNATRTAHIYPATHDAGSTELANVPAMGQRVRLRADFAIPANYTKQERAVALALKKYGAMVADNGNFFSISVAPDNRFPAGCFSRISQLAITNFDVIQTTGPAEGPRAAGAPTADAGADQTVNPAAGATLPGVVGGTGVSSSWAVNPNATAPGTVTFADAAKASTTATFSAEGTYTLLLKASSDTHGSVYDAVVITVSSQAPNRAPTAPTGLNAVGFSSSAVDLSWTDASANESGFKVERSPDGTTGWTSMTTTAANAISYRDSSLVAATTYHYRVRATNSVGDSAYTAVASGTTSSAGGGGGGTPPVDSDADGVNDADEARFGTNPNNANSKPGGSADFDGDGFFDDTDSDADGDGVSNTNETAGGSNPYDAKSFVTIPLKTLSVSGGVNLSLSGKDSCSVSALIPALPAGLKFDKKTVLMDCAGVPFSFVFDARGRAKVTSGGASFKFKLARNKTTKALEFLGGDVLFKAKVTKGSWKANWVDDGIVSDDRTKAAVSLPLTIYFNGSIYTGVAASEYSAKSGKTGSIKVPKP